MYNTNELNSFKYAQMQSTILNKSSASSASNAKINLKSKFAQIEESLHNIEEELRELVTSTNETLRLSSHLKVQLGDRQLQQQHGLLNEEVKKLDKAVKYGITQSEKRTENLWNECKERINCTEKLKYSMKSLTDRINRLETTLGFYVAAQTMI